jgi:hypothetical protein
MAKIEFMVNAFQSDLKPRARLVLQCLALHCNKDGQCFPAIKTIARECGYSVNTVKRALGDLVEAGFVVKEARFDKERKHGGQTSNLYVLKDVEPKGEVEKVPSQDEVSEGVVENKVDEKSVEVEKGRGVAKSGMGVGSQGLEKVSTVGFPMYNFSWAGEEPNAASP